MIIASTVALALAAAQPPGLGPSDAAAVSRWTWCLTQAAEARTVAGAEPEAVADAAVAACRGEEDAVVAISVRHQGPAAADEARAGFQRGARDYVANRTRVRLAAIAEGPVSAGNSAHGACVGERVGLEAVSTSRSAQAIVDEAIVACRPQEERLHAAVAAERGRAAADTAVAEVRAGARRSGLALVADTRRPQPAR